MGYISLELEEINEVLASEDKLKILLDSNVLLSYLDKEHKFNYEATTIIEPLKDKNCYFFIHYIVIGEFINKWLEIKGGSVNDAIKIISNFTNNSLKYSLHGGKPLTSEVIFSSFKKHARHKNFIKAHFNDFVILVEAENIRNIKIVTCDKAMCDAGRSIFKKNIYYLPLNTKKAGSELSRFIKDMAKVKM